MSIMDSTMRQPKDIATSDLDPDIPLTFMKGMPGTAADLLVRDVGRQGWNILAEDLPLPLAVLHESVLAHNSRWMRAFIDVAGIKICPHGKTTMSPALFQRQILDGAWGLTCATTGHLKIYRAAGIRRVIYANQLVGRQNIRYVLEELRRDSEFDFYCLVDSVAGVDLLQGMVQEFGLDRPLQVLLEVGLPAGRTGVRDLEAVAAVASRVASAAPHLRLHGIECFEGIAHGCNEAETEGRVAALLDLVIAAARLCDSQGWFGGSGPVILTAGGSRFFDLVPQALGHAGLSKPVDIVIRSGCYLSHDSLHYAAAFDRMRERMPALNSLGEGLKPALEIWAYVQSRPELERVYCTFGKRDASHDLDLPKPIKFYRPSEPEAGVRPLGGDHVVTGLNDQHAYLAVAPDSPLQVGDMVAFGISHPCTTFDKWSLIMLVDESYRVTGAIRTYF